MGQGRQVLRRQAELKGTIAKAIWSHAPLPQLKDESMKLERRRFLRLASYAAALPALSRSAAAQAYPTRTVRIVVPYPAGIAPDVATRLVAPALSQRLGQQFIVDNRPGGAANVGDRKSGVEGKSV